MSIVGPRGKIRGAFRNVCHRGNTTNGTRTEDQACCQWYAGLIERHITATRKGINESNARATDKSNKHWLAKLAGFTNFSTRLRGN